VTKPRILLAFDTAGPVIGASLRVDDEVWSFSQRVTAGADAVLLDAALGLLRAQGLRMADVGRVAVSRGPGAFTGLRVGLALAQGLAHGLGVPLFGCDSLSTRAAAQGDGTSLAMLDARKGRVYAGLYQGGVEVVPPSDVPPHEALGWGAAAGAVATGEGALVYADLVSVAGLTVGDNAENPATDVLARLALEAWDRGDACAEVGPLYVRAPSAQRPGSITGDGHG
jgi:tRNA threonylcarbamoyladenosine biosynthesis protein TsaB